MNSLNIAGYIGQDAESRTTQTGTVVTKFSVPVEQGWGDNKKTTWVECILFGKKGTNEPHGLVNYLHKGKFVAVTGELVLDQWEHDGKSYSKVTCIVRDVKLGPGDETKTYEEAGSVKAPAQPLIDDDSIPF